MLETLARSGIVALTALAVGCGGEGAPGNPDGPVPGPVDAAATAADTGGDGPASQPADGGAALTYYPLKVGNWWRYRITSPFEAPWEKLVTAERMEPVGGDGPSAATPAIRMVTRKGPSDMTINWQGWVDEPDGRVWVRYRETGYSASTGMVNVEDWWDPHRLRFDERAGRLQAGARYQETYVEYKRDRGGLPVMTPVSTSWEVEAAGETVVVPIPGAAARSYPDCVRVSHSLGTPGARKQFWFCRGVGKVKETGGQTEELVDHLVVWP
jgi:hypothetical protein